MIVVQRDADLAEVIETLRRARGLTRCLHRRQQQRRQQADDTNHDYQLDYRETEFGTDWRASFHRYCPRGFPIAPDRGQHPLGSHGSWGAPINCVDLAK